MEPRGYYDPPSEREWTIEEREEFYAGYDARKAYPDGVACNHSGCLSHLSHPCEGCGRIGGRYGSK